MSSARVTFVIPTLNSGRVLRACLDSILAQDLPRDTYRICIVDAGSEDDTLRIAEEKGVDVVLPNPRQTGEAGKSVGLAAAETDLVAFIDSDNLLEHAGWLRAMLAPFDDPDICASETDRFTYRREDSAVDRYCALMGLNDPIHLFLGNYGRLCTLTGKWTAQPIVVLDRCAGYDKVRLIPGHVPTLGANGYVVRRRVLADVATSPYYFDIDVVQELVAAGHATFASVPVGVVHLFCPDLRTYARKQRRRIRDYLFYKSQEMRTYRHDANRFGYVLFVLATLTILPVVVQAVLGYTRKPDRAWLLHPVLCWITLVVYGRATIAARFRPRAEARHGWSQ